MIPQPQCRAVFRYEYRPLTKMSKRAEKDAGFSLTVYENDTAVFSMYELTQWADIYADVVPRNAQRVKCTRSVYPLDENFAPRYMELLSQWDYALRETEKNICMPEGRVARYCSSFGFHGYEMICCDEPVLLSQSMPLTTAEGRAARRLIPIFEDIAVLLGKYHIHLQFNDWSVDDDTHPIEYQPGMTGQTPPVTPDAMGM